MPDRSRDRIWLQPLGTSRRLSLHTNVPVVGGGRRLAEMDSSGHYDTDYFGWLTVLPSGTYVHERVNGAIRRLDERKVEAAMHYLSNPQSSATELAATLHAWRRGDRTDGEYLFSSTQAAEMLGMSERTYEGIEQGRGFRYPKLLYLALKAFE